MGRYRIEEYVRWEDIDAAGIINYQAYLRFFGLAEAELLRSAGLNFRFLFESLGIWLPRAHVECDFHEPVRFDELLVVEAYFPRIGRTSLHLHFEVRRRERPEALRRDGPVRPRLRPPGQLRAGARPRRDPHPPRPLRRASRPGPAVNAGASSGVRAVLFDIEGTLCVAGRPVPGAAEAVAALVGPRRPDAVRHEHDEPSRAASSLSELLAMGIPCGPEPALHRGAGGRARISRPAASGARICSCGRPCSRTSRTSSADDGPPRPSSSEISARRRRSRG